MRHLDEVRKDINEVSEEMARLFLRRMELSREVVEYKIQHQVPIFDERREKELLDRMVETTQPGPMETYFRDFLQALMEISKDFQQNFTEECRKKPGVGEKTEDSTF